MKKRYVLKNNYRIGENVMSSNSFRKVVKKLKELEEKEYNEYLEYYQHCAENFESPADYYSTYYIEDTLTGTICDISDLYLMLKLLKEGFLKEGDN